MEKLKQFIKTNQSAVILAVVILILVGGWFYWFQLRPSQIRKECAKISSYVVKNPGSENYYLISEKEYSTCLRREGLEK